MPEKIIRLTKFYSPDGNLEGDFGYDDAQGIVGSALSGTTVWTNEAYRDTPFILPFVSHNQDDYAQIIIQMPHRKKIGSLKSFHVHTIPMATPTGTQYVEWELKYYWFSNNEELPAQSSWISPSNTLQPITSSDVFKHKIHTLASDIVYPATAEGASSIFVAQIKRLGNTGTNDTYTASKSPGTAAANLAVLYFDAHFDSNRSGTASEYS